MWLHRNNVYNIAVLEQLSRIVLHRGKLHVLKRLEATLLCPLRVQPRAGPQQAFCSGWFSELLR